MSDEDTLNQGKQKICQKRSKFSMEEMSALKTFFKTHIGDGRVPSFLDVQRCKEKYGILNQRTDSSIRSKVHLISKKLTKE